MVEQRLMFKYRLYPSQKQLIKLESNLKICKNTWNDLLSFNKKELITNKFDFNDIVLDLKIVNSDYSKKVHSQVLQNVSDRLHKAFYNFFCRLKLKKQGKKIKAGYPRFKTKINSITFPQGGFKIKKNKLFVSKIGNVPIILSRPIKGEIKTLTLKKNAANQWFAVFSSKFEIDDSTLVHPSTEKTGIDMGIEKFATMSEDIPAVSNPNYFRLAEKKLSKEQRRLSRKVKGSKNYQKQKVKVAKVHLDVFNKRTDFLHKTTSILSKKFKYINVEKLMIQNMVKNHHLSKSILDAGWGRFFNMLSYKEVILGGKLERLDPKNTSKTCSQCQTLIDMPLKVRTFVCPTCGLKLNRDKNASINIKNKNDTVGLTEIYTPIDSLPIQSRFNAIASRVDEIGTICSTRRVS